jgi:hypothetical protein
MSSAPNPLFDDLRGNIEAHAMEDEEKVWSAEFFRAHGKAGGHLGGTKAAANMTPEQRRARAAKAVAARKWHPPVSDEEMARRMAAKRPVGRPRKVVLEGAKPKLPVGRPKKSETMKSA